MSRPMTLPAGKVKEILASLRDAFEELHEVREVLDTLGAASDCSLGADYERGCEKAHDLRSNLVAIADQVGHRFEIVLQPHIEEQDEGDPQPTIDLAEERDRRSRREAPAGE